MLSKLWLLSTKTLSIFNQSDLNPISVASWPMLQSLRKRSVFATAHQLVVYVKSKVVSRPFAGGPTQKTVD